MRKEANVSEDLLKMTRTKLPEDVRKTIRRLTEPFDAASKASIGARLEGSFSKIEHKTAPDGDSPEAPAAAGALREGAVLTRFTDAVARKKK